jgi:hypothetical protein
MRQKKNTALSNGKKRARYMANTYAHRMLLSVVLLGAAMFYSESAFADSPNDILVITSLSIKVQSVTIEEVKDFFLKERTSWPSGEKVIPINTGDDPALRDKFRDLVLKMSTAQEQRFWQTKKIKGGEGEPPVLNNVLKAVFKLRGAISYVSRSQYKEGVAKVILVIPAK